MFNKRSSRRIPFVLSLPVLRPTEGSKYVRAAMPVTPPPNVRSSLALRLSPLLILAAAALVALAVFFVNYNAPPASADHTGTNNAWSARLTVQDVGSGSLGCLNDLSVSAKKCSTGTTLTDYEFELPDADVTIRAIFLSSSGLEFYPSSTAQRDALQAHTLFVDGVPFRFANASRVGGTTGVRWASPGLTWSVGDTVQLILRVDLSEFNLPSLTASVSPDPIVEGSDLWSATLMVKDLTTPGSAPENVGCDDDDSQASAPCSSALSPRNFTFKGVAYTVKAISYNQRKVAADPNNVFNVTTYPESLKLTLDKTIPESFQSCLALHSGNAKVPFADDGLPGASVDSTLSGSTLTVTAIGAVNAGDLGWGLNWSAGQTVQLRLPNVGCLTLTLSEPVTEETSLQWRRGGTADLSGDYQRISLPTFAAGSTSVSTPIRVIDDSDAEGCETIILDMTMWPGTYRAVHERFTVAIQDNDGGNACVGGG